jgi:hypothetical protein
MNQRKKDPEYRRQDITQQGMGGENEKEMRKEEYNKLCAREIHL